MGKFFKGKKLEEHIDVLEKNLANIKMRENEQTGSLERKIRQDFRDLKGDISPSPLVPMEQAGFSSVTMLSEAI